MIIRSDLAAVSITVTPFCDICRDVYFCRKTSVIRTRQIHLGFKVKVYLGCVTVVVNRKVNLSLGCWAFFFSYMLYICVYTCMQELTYFLFLFS